MASPHGITSNRPETKGTPVSTAKVKEIKTQFTVFFYYSVFTSYGSVVFALCHVDQRAFWGGRDDQGILSQSVRRSALFLGASGMLSNNEGSESTRYLSQAVEYIDLAASTLHGTAHAANSMYVQQGSRSHPLSSTQREACMRSEKRQPCPHPTAASRTSPSDFQSLPPSSRHPMAVSTSGRGPFIFILVFIASGLRSVPLFRTTISR